MGRPQPRAEAIGLSADRDALLAAAPVPEALVVRSAEFRVLTLVYGIALVLTNPFLVGLSNLLFFRGGGPLGLLPIPLWAMLAVGSLLVARAARERVLGVLLTADVLAWFVLLVAVPTAGDLAPIPSAAAGTVASALATTSLYMFSAGLVQDRADVGGFRLLGLNFGIAVAVLGVLWTVVGLLPELAGTASATVTVEPVWFVIPFAMLAAAIASAVAFLQIVRGVPDGDGPSG